MEPGAAMRLIADLHIGLHYLSNYAVSVGAFTKDEAKEFRADGWKTLLAVGHTQSR